MSKQSTMKEIQAYPGSGYFHSIMNQSKISLAFVKVRSLTNQFCLQIVKYLAKQDEACVTDIWKALKIDQSLASTTLRHLRKANVVTARRDGKWIYYSLNYSEIEKIANACKNFSKIN